MYKILIAEDNESLGYVLKEYLSMNGYEVTLAATGNEALAAFQKQHYDLCLLDVILPGSNGFDVAVKIKEVYPIIPIIFLTARALKVDKIKGFKIGADDYIVKPADEEELLLRIRSVIKRAYPSENSISNTYKMGTIYFEPGNRLLLINKTSVMLTEKEAKILSILCENKGNLVQRQHILRKVWNENSFFTARTMDVHLSKLRKYLAAEPAVQIINVHGKGFMLVVKYT